MKRAVFVAGASVALLVLVEGAAGQTASVAPATGPGAQTSPVATEGNGLQEVTVTARRVAESKQTTPVSISAFNSDALIDNGIGNAADLQQLVPGIILNGAGNTDNTTYTIRGQGKAVIGPGLPSVITYVNEVPLPSWGSSPPTFDIDNIQILKGPQGTSFGRNTTGGAVLVYTAPPTYNFGGFVQAQAGNYGDNEYQGALNLPIIDQKLAVRLSAAVERRDGYTTNVATGRNLDGKHSNAVRLSVLLQPLDLLEDRFEFDYTRYATNGVGIFPYQYVGPPAQFPGLAAAIAVQQALGKRAVATTNDPTVQNSYWGVSNTTTADFDILTVKNIFGYRNTNVAQALDATGLPLAPLPPFLGPLAGLPGIYSDALAVRRDRQFSDELQFSGTGLDKKLTWLAGAFFLRDEPSGPDYLILDDFRPVSPYFVVPPSLPSPISSLEDNLYTDESHSAYFTGTYGLGHLAGILEPLELNFGYRYTWDREGLCANGRSEISFLTGAPLVAPYQSLDQCRADTTSYSASSTFKAPTYTAGLDYTVSDDLFLYFTNRRGYRAGGINSPAMASSLAGFQTYNPQKVTDYEIGLHEKWRLDGWKGRFNIDAYVDKYSALQVQATGILAGDIVGGVPITPQTQPSNTLLTLNAGTATFAGVELDGSISPFPGLDFNYGAAYINAKYDTLTVPDVIRPFFTTAKLDGAPRWSYQASVRYVLPVHPSAGGDISVYANYYHIDRQYQQFSLLPAHELTDFSVAWSRIAARPINLTFFVNNAFNTFYIQNVAIGQPGLGEFSGNYGPPRMYGVRLRYTFGE